MAIDTEILRRIQKHYSSTSRPLMLSTLGKELRVEGLWPVEGENRSLRQIIESLRPEADVVVDPNSPSFLVAVAKGRESIGRDAVTARKELRFLSNLPRSVLIAFVVDANGKPVFLQTHAPFRYVVGEQQGDGYVQVEDEFRVSGLLIDNLGDLSASQATTIAENITSWSSKHGISLEAFANRGNASSEELVAFPQAREPRAQPGGRTALDRLMAAQSPDVARRINLPLDIAQTLSRIP